MWSRRDFVRAGVGVAAAPILWSCGSPTEPTIVRLTARPGEPTQTPQLGLSTLGLGGERDGILYVPTSYDPNVSTPLIVALHGAGGADSDWVNYHARAEARGFVLLAPDSRGATWDLFWEGTVGSDLFFINLALAHTFDRCRIDRQRICLAGFSDGGSYALTLGLPNGDLFTHLIGYSPGVLADIGDPVGKPRVFISHGTFDPILSVRASRNEIVPELRGAGYDTTYEEFPGGHEVPAAISEAALDWLLEASSAGQAAA
ncbi:MAG: alpha/beta hydrolase [Gemmatimonadales bacterium]